MKGISLLLTPLVYCSNIGPIRANLPKVCLDGSSCLLGRYMSGNESDSFEAFLGIPYAKPPIGDLRFSNPQEVELWNGTLTALYPMPDCIQRNYLLISDPISGSEDCLYLNIYRPLNNTGGELPVMFYIHGGGFFAGSPSPSEEGPQYFMETSDVILVVTAYRLGPFNNLLICRNTVYFKLMFFAVRKTCNKGIEDNEIVGEIAKNNVRPSSENVINIGKPMHCLYDDVDRILLKKIKTRWIEQPGCKTAEVMYKTYAWLTGLTS